MDNITHSLTGLALARSGLNRFCPYATALLVVSANAPDVDAVAWLRGSLSYLEIHRGYTHSLILLPVMALLSVLLVALLVRKRLFWWRAWVLCGIGVASHLLLDWTNSYGIRLFLPFSSRWFHLDINSLYDVCILAMLAFAALWPSFANLVGKEIGTARGSGRGLAILSLVFFLLFDFGRAILHNRAVAQLDARLFDQAPPLRTAALPDPFSPIRWTGVVETATSYWRLPVNPLNQLDTQSAAIFFKPPAGEQIKKAQATEPFRYFSYFARFPIWNVQPEETEAGAGYLVSLTDLRFGSPQSGGFHCFAIENAQNNVLQSSFTFRSQPPTQ